MLNENEPGFNGFNPEKDGQDLNNQEIKKDSTIENNQSVSADTHQETPPMVNHIGPGRYERTKDTITYETHTKSVRDWKRLTAKLVGVAGLAGFVGLNTFGRKGAKTKLPPKSVPISEQIPGKSLENLAIPTPEKQQDPELNERMKKAYQEVESSMLEISEGKAFNGEFKDKLINLDNSEEELGNDYIAMIESTLEQSNKPENTSGQRMEDLENGLNGILKHYVEQSATTPSNQQKEFSQETALAMTTLINEHLSQRHVTSLEGAVKSAKEAGMVKSMEAVMEEMSGNENHGRIVGDSLRLMVDGQEINLKDPAISMIMSNQAIRLPLGELDGVTLDNIYNVKEKDPKRYEEIVHELAEKNIPEVSQQIKERTGLELDKDTLRKSISEAIENGQPINGQTIDKDIDLVNFHLELDRLWNALPMPSVSVDWGSQLKDVSISTDIDAYDGVINQKILCEGNHISAESLTTQGEIANPDRKGIYIPLMLLLLPLILTRLKWKEKEYQKKKKIPNWKFIPDPLGGGPGNGIGNGVGPEMASGIGSAIPIPKVINTAEGRKIMFFGGTEVNADGTYKPITSEEIRSILLGENAQKDGVGSEGKPTALLVEFSDTDKGEPTGVIKVSRPLIEGQPIPETQEPDKAAPAATENPMFNSVSQVPETNSTNANSVENTPINFTPAAEAKSTEAAPGTETEAKNEVNNNNQLISGIEERSLTASEKVKQRIDQAIVPNIKTITFMAPQWLASIKNEFSQIIENPNDVIGDGNYEGWSKAEIKELYSVIYNEELEE